MRDDVKPILHGPRRLPFGHVPRHRLLPAFRHRGANATLLCAPAGFGKSTLVREWLDFMARPCLYYAPPAQGAEPDRLWVVLAQGLRRLDERLGAGAMNLLELPSPDFGQVADHISTDLARLGQDVVIVIEDLHLYDDASVHRDIGRLAKQLPDHAHLVLTSRSRPDIPMALLRSREQLAEISADDLRITAPEISDYLERVGLEGTPEIVDHLERVTGGWAAGLGLLVAAAQRRGDPMAFLSDGHVLTSQIGDLLRAEVLADLDDDVRELLTATSFLPTLSPGLCDRVTGSDNSADILRHLSVSQAFVHRIEGPGERYALHHLLGDLLRSDLDQRDPDELVVLRNRASEWFEQSGRPADALEQAMLAGNADRVRQLVAEHAYVLHDRGHQALVRRALRDAESTMPSGVEEALSVAEAIAFAGYGGSTLRVLAMLERSEITDQATVGRLAVLRCITSAFAGDLDRARSAHVTAIDLLGELPYDELGLRTRLNLARCLRLAGDLDGAEEQIRALVALHGDELHPVSLFARGTLASIHLDRGHLDQAGKLVESAVSEWDQRGRPLVAAAAEIYLVLGALAQEAGEVDRARELYAYTLAMTALFRQGLLRALVLAQSGVFEARCGNHEVADSLVGEIPTWWPEFPPGLHLRQSYHRAQAELLLAAGRPEEARTHVADLIAEPGTSAAVCVGTLRTRVRLALGEADESDLEVPPGLDDVALPVRLARLLVVADVHLALGDHDAATDIGREAVALGLAAGFRATLGHSSAVRSLGRRLAPPGDKGVVDQILAMTAGGDPDESTDLTVLLSDKEQAVLAFLPTHLSYAGIAAELFVSVNTVKFHLKNVYGKLGVNDRAGAVHRARELGLITDR